MPTPGSRRSPRKRSARAITVTAAASVLLSACSAAAEALRPYVVEDDAIEAPLTGERGDPARGRAIVVDRRRGLCLLCHSGPFPETRFKGTLAPSLAGAGERWSEGQLRLRLVDSTRLNPATIMPPYYRIEGLNRVGEAWQDKPILTAEEIEDVVSFLSTLKEVP